VVGSDVGVSMPRAVDDLPVLYTKSVVLLILNFFCFMIFFMKLPCNIGL